MIVIIIFAGLACKGKKGITDHCCYPDRPGLFLVVIENDQHFNFGDLTPGNLVIAVRVWAGRSDLRSIPSVEKSVANATAALHSRRDLYNTNAVSDH